MAEEHVNPADETSAETNNGTRSVMADDNTATTESSTFFTANEEYCSTRIQSLMESRSEFKTAVESEIEASKEHWSELPTGMHGEEGSSAEKNLAVFRSLQQQYNIEADGFFIDWLDDEWALGEKIAEGAQGEIFKLRWLHPELAKMNDRLLLKVFKLEGWSLADLRKQWPPDMLLNVRSTTKPFYSSGFGSEILRGLMLEGERFAFVMLRYWGDLRKVIDLRMQHNGNQAPPFTHDTAFRIMWRIARGMRALHKDNIVHRDLKASNVLILPDLWTEDDEVKPKEGFDPVSSDEFLPYVADFETSLGVLGTRFWRAPEILFGVKNQDVEPSLFTERSDVYSYAMTCYEILTGKIPLEDVRASDYDAILLHGVKPRLPSGMEPWIESLLSRCWNHDPFQRPLFGEIDEEFNDKRGIENN